MKSMMTSMNCWLSGIEVPNSSMAKMAMACRFADPLEILLYSLINSTHEVWLLVLRTAVSSAVLPIVGTWGTSKMH